MLTFASIIDTPNEPQTMFNFPVLVENKAMLVHFIEGIQKTFEITLQIISFDETKQVFWLQIPHLSNVSVPYLLLNFGYRFFLSLRKMKKGKQTQWNFPFLQPNYKPQFFDSQYIFEAPTYVHLRDWNEKYKLTGLLESMNELYGNPENEKFGGYLLLMEDGTYHSQGSYEKVLVQTILSPTPIAASLLLELGVRIAEYNYQLSISKQKHLEESITSKISALLAISNQRHLLARERYELDILQKLQQAQTTDALQQLQSEVENTPTDADLKAILLKRIAKKADLV